MMRLGGSDSPDGGQGGAHALLAFCHRLVGKADNRGIARRQESAM